MGSSRKKRKLQKLNLGRFAMDAVLELLRHDSLNLMQPGFDGLDHLSSFHLHLSC
jgi:hypothetical protein